MYQLQLPQFYKESNPMDMVYFGIGLGITIIVLVIVNISRKRLGITDSGFTASRPKSGGSFAIQKFSRSIGLDSSQTKMLSFVMKNGGTTDPERMLQSSALLDRHFRQAYHAIEQTTGAEDETQQKLSVLFATRNILESTTGGGVGVNSTRVIPENTPAVLIVDKNNYPVRVISSRGAYLLVNNPVNALGDIIPIGRNKPVILSFFTKSSNGFSVQSTVYGTTKAPGEGQVLQVVHSSTIKRLSQRRFRRRMIVSPAEFNLVWLEPGARKHEQKMVVDKRKASGKILDISVGGCSIQTASVISAGVRLKIGFTASGQHIVALGEVLRINRNRTGTVMHIKFLKVPRKSLNLINALVFEYIDT
ncbi:MAG: PilZ domain-containing protein [Treponema sp.]|nr:PilZ domain-containing protein [Treponema sp.]